MSTRTAPFEMTIAVDASCNVSGTYSHVEGWTTGGGISGKLVGGNLVVMLRQANGRGGAGVMKVINDAKMGIGLDGPVAQDADPYPLNDWAGYRKRFEPVTKLKVKPSAPTALSDVDVYSGPGGRFSVIGMMRKGAAGAKLDHNADGWCKLQGVGPGGADGWIADDHLSGC